MFFPLRDNNPTARRPVMTWGLIGFTSAVFLIEFAIHPQHLKEIAYLFGIVPARYSHPDWALRVGFPIDDYWPFLTSMFLHAGLVHIASNMWVLWIFGDNVEDRMGRLRFLAFYLVCGIVAGLVHWLANPHSTVPALGASGAIAGVLGAYLVLYPRARVETLLLLVFWPIFLNVPAVVFIVSWFGIQLLSGTAALLDPQQMGGIAWWAHVGGFVAGVSLHRLFIARSKSFNPAS
jgi:membrane associated rhomboid family serine protease